MFEAIVNGLSGLTASFAHLHWSNPVMIAVGCLFLYLAIQKDVEPLLLVPIGFGAIITNIPLAELMAEEGFLRVIYNMGVANELFPLLIFIGIGAMTDFGPLLENPKIFLLGAAGQFGAEGPGPCRVCRTSQIRLSTGSGGMYSARFVQAELKRICPSGGKSGGRRTARRPSQRARARPCSVARRAQS